MRAEVSSANKIGDPACDTLKIGEVGEVVGKSKIHYDGLLLRTYSGFVNLNNPEQTWLENCAVLVRKLPEGTKIELTL